jgi:hypothetical protein
LDKVFDEIGALGFLIGDKRNGLVGFFVGKFETNIFWLFMSKFKDSWLISLAEASKAPKINNDSIIIIDCFTKRIN